MRDRFISGAALVATLVLLLAGCGGSSSSDQTARFKTSYEPVRAQLQQTGQAIGSAVQQAASRSDAQILVTFRDLATRWQSRLSQLATLKPPSRLAAGFNTLTSAGTRVESDLRAIVAAVATHSAAAGKQAGASIVIDFSAVRSADATLARKLGIT